MLTRVFFNQKPVRALASLAKEDRVWYPSMLCKEIDCTYPHMINVLRGFEEAGLISTHGQGRIKIIKLTDLGEDLAREFSNLLRRLEKADRQSSNEPEKEAATEVSEVEEEKKTENKKK